MNWDRRRSRLTPRPPLRKSERGSLIALMMLALAACPGTPNGTAQGAQGQDSSAVVAGWPTEDSTLVYVNPIRTAFMERYAGLDRVGAGLGVLFYPRNGGEVINRLRSTFSAGDPAYADDGLDTEDLVVLRLRLPGTPGGVAYVVFSEGPSGDPGFYFIDAETGHQSEIVWGELLAIPVTGPWMMYQRSNEFYPRVKRVQLDGSRFWADSVATDLIGLHTIAIDTVRLWRTPIDSAVVALLAPRDSVEVVERGPSVDRWGPLFKVRTTAGVIGWIRLSESQCPGRTIRGLCYNGD